MFLKIRKSITAPSFAKSTKDSPKIADNGSLVTASLQGTCFWKSALLQRSQVWQLKILKSKIHPFLRVHQSLPNSLSQTYYKTSSNFVWDIVNNSPLQASWEVHCFHSRYRAYLIASVKICNTFNDSLSPVYGWLWIQTCEWQTNWMALTCSNQSFPFL